MPFKKPPPPETPEFFARLEEELRQAAATHSRKRLWLAATKRRLLRRLRPILHGSLAACLAFSFSFWGYQQTIQTSTTVLAPPGGTLSAAELNAVQAWIDPPPTADFSPEVQLVVTPQDPAEEPVPFRIA